MRVAVTGEYGRFGGVALTTESETFLPLKTLLREALGSAGEARSCAREDFLAALKGPSVYCDFLADLPLDYLADLLGAGGAADLSARCLVAAEQSGATVLLLRNGEDACFRLSTALPASALTEVVEGFALGSASFAFEGSDPYSAALAPLYLLPDALPELPVLTVSASAPAEDTLLSVLRFNLHTNSRYTESGGTEVIVEGDRSLRIGANGTVSYASGDEAVVTIAPSPAPSLSEATAGACALLDSMLSGGAARLYLRAVSERGGARTLTLDYQVGGVPLRYTDALPAAEITLSGNVVTGMVFRLRQYAETGEVSTLLPLRQAMAIAAEETGANLSVGYADSGVYPLSATYLAD